MASSTSAARSARSSACCSRCVTPSSRPAAARSWTPTIAPRSTSTASRSGSTSRSRRSCSASPPPAAGRGSRADGTSLRAASDRVRAGARPRRRRHCARGRDRRARPRTSRNGLTVRYLLLSDLHGNIDAFDAVLEHAQGSWDRAIVLGDLVGYGAEPNLVIDKVRALDPISVIRGNHDKASCGLDDGSQFNQVARLAAAWTGQFLTPGNRTYLRELPMGPVQIDDMVEICHGAPF